MSSLSNRPPSFADSCSQICVDGAASQHYIVSTGQMKEVGRSPAKKIRPTSHTRTDPKAARSPKLPCWMAWVKRIGVHDATGAEGSRARSRREPRALDQRPHPHTG